MPGRFKDYIAMPKFNGYRALHTTVIGRGRPLEIQVRTLEMHLTAEYGVAAHWLYKGSRRKQRDDEWTKWVRQLMDEGVADEADPREFMKSFRDDLFDEEVFVFTPKGEVKTLPAGRDADRLRVRRPHRRRHRTVGAKVNGRIVPLHYRLRSGDRVEILTGKSAARGLRDWLSLVARRAPATRSASSSPASRRRTSRRRAASCSRTRSRARTCPYKKLAAPPCSRA
jgi:Guanosine polyphosphate pyrophosphohydrolases/synthetases